MTAVLVGCGSIGLRHLRNLRRLAAAGRILAVDPEPSRRELAREAGAEPCAGLDAALATRPDLVMVCTPPDLHLDAGRTAIRAGAHVFLEKPVAATLDGVPEFVADVERSDRAVLVGYNLRFERGMRRAKRLLEEGAIGRLLAVRGEFGQYLPDWRPTQDYRLGYNAHAAAGGGIVLDASHELDYVQWLAGPVRSVSATTAKLSDLEIDVEDTALITLRLDGGVLAQLQLDSIQRAYSRSCKLIGTEGTITWGLREGVSLYHAADRVWRQVEAPAEDPNEMYLEEMRHLLACVRGEAQPLITAAAGALTLRIALAVKQSAAERREIAV